MTCSLPIQSFIDVYSNVKRSKTSNSSPATPLYLSVSLHLYSSTSLHLSRSTFLCHYFSTIHNDEMTEDYKMPKLSGSHPLLCGVVPLVLAHGGDDPDQPLAEPSPARTRSRTPPTLRSIDCKLDRILYVGPLSVLPFVFPYGAEGAVPPVAKRVRARSRG